MTNMAPTDAVRGAGRPEATYVVERAVDALARHVGKDPAEVRRISFAPSHAEAKPSLMGLQIDSADYLPAFERALELADYDQYRKEQASRRESGDVKQIGIGLSSYIEMSGLAPSNILGALRYAAGGWEAAQVRCQPSGKVTLVHRDVAPRPGSRHRPGRRSRPTSSACTPDDVEVLHGDTSITPLGHGHVRLALDLDRRRGAAWSRCRRSRTRREHWRRTSSRCRRTTSSSEDGAFRVQGAPDKVRTIPELAVSAWTAHDLPDGYEPDLTAIATWDPKNFTWPFGTHVCVAEVDTETGANRAAPVRSGRRLRRRDQPDDRRRSGARWRRVRDRRGAVRGDPVRRARQPDHGDADPVPRARRLRRCRRSSSIAPRRPRRRTRSASRGSARPGRSRRRRRWSTRSWTRSRTSA